MSLNVFSSGTGTADALVGVLTDSEANDQLVLDIAGHDVPEIDLLAEALNEMSESVTEGPPKAKARTGPTSSRRPTTPRASSTTILVEVRPTVSTLVNAQTLEEALD